MKDKVLNNFRNNGLYYLTFLSGCIIILILYILQKVAPFGRNSMLTIDFFHQYGPMLGELYDRIRNGSSLIYSFSMGMGLPFFRNFLNYLSSPFNVLIFLFKREHIVMSYSLIIGLKAICASTTMVYYLSKKMQNKNLYLLPLGILFGFCAYFTAYYWNIMWLDGLVFLPLIIYGIEKLIDENKCLFYIISLAIMLIANYFIGFMICIFSCLYFIGYLIIKTDKINIQKILKKCILFGICSLLAGGLTAILLLPLFLSLGSISATSDLWPTSQYYAFSFWEYLANHFSGVGSAVLSSGVSKAANISCGVLSVVLLLLFIVNNKIKLKVKIVYLSLLLFIVASFFYAPLDFIWHGLHVPNDLPYRYSFIYSFILIVICAYSLCSLKYLKIKVIGAIYMIMLIFISFLYFFNYKNIDSQMIMLNFILITIYFILYILRLYYPMIKKLIPYVFILTIIVECTIIINHNWHINQYIDEFYSDYDQVREVIDFIEEKDDNIYRIDRTSILTFNDPSWYSYYGQTTFSSMAYENMAVLQSALGLPGNNINSYYYKQTTPVYDLMFNIKYFIGDTWDTTRYTSFYNNGINVFKNNYNAGLMFAVNKEVINTSHGHADPFYIQNAFVEKTTGIKNVFRRMLPIDHEVIYNNNQTIIKYTFNNPGDNMYFYTREYDVDFMVVNETLYYLNDNYEYVFNVDQEVRFYNYVNFNEKFIINAKTDMDTFNIYIGYNNFRYDAYYAYTINNDKFIAAATQLQNNKVMVSEFKEHYIKGQISITEDKTIYTSIPYDQGWQVWVDGKKVKPIIIGNTLLAFNINPGNHEIILKYIPKGIISGLVISTLSLTFIIGGYLYKRKKTLKSN